MSHVRTQIRAALVALLEDVSGLQGRVVSDPAEIKDASDGPWLELTLDAEQVVGRTLGSQVGGRRLQRRFIVYIDQHDRGGSEAIARMETLAAQLEAAVFAGKRLGSLLLTPLTLEELRPSEPDTIGAITKRRNRLTYTATYSTTEADASVALSN